MKNIDKIRQMSAEEFADFFNKKSTCGLCVYYHEICNQSCWGGIKEWLNQETNPMPKLRNGDIIISKGESLSFFYGYPYGYSRTPDGLVKMAASLLTTDYVSKIYRYNSGKKEIEEIWRADK